MTAIAREHDTCNPGVGSPAGKTKLPVVSTRRDHILEATASDANALLTLEDYLSKLEFKAKVLLKALQRDFYEPL